MPKSKVTLPFLRSLLPRFDLTGFALFAPASIMFLLALQFGASEYSWNSREVIGLLCGAGALMLVFLAWEWRTGDDAMIPLGLVARRVMWCSSLTSAFLMSTNIIGGTFFPMYLQSVRGLSPVTSGLYLLPSVGSQIFFVVLSGALSKLFSPSDIIPDLRVIDLDGWLTPCQSFSGSVAVLHPLGCTGSRRICRYLRTHIYMGCGQYSWGSFRLPSHVGYQRRGHASGESWSRSSLRQCGRIAN